MESIPDEMDRTVDRFPPVRPPSEFSDQHSSNNNICSSKQLTEVVRPKYQFSNRSTSLPSRQAFSANINTIGNVRQRRRHASDSNNNNQNLTTSLITSFLQYLRSELRATTNDQKYDYSSKKSLENINYLSQPLKLSNQFYRQQYPIRMSRASSSSSQSLELNFSPLSNENLPTKNLDEQDEHEISKLINLLILRVECLANEKNNSLPPIKQVDDNLIEYLYYLFNKFTQDEIDSSTPMIDKTNFVHVCQTLVRHECLNIPSTTSPEQSVSETTMTNTTDLTLTQPFVREYRAETDEMSFKTPSSNDQETWLVVDFESMQPKYSATTPDQSKCLLPSSSSSSTADEQFFLFPNENYFSFEEVKSCASESSQSNYFSPNSSLVDLQNMVQELDEMNNTNNNNNNNTLFNEDQTATIEHASSSNNVITEDTDTTNTNRICTGLTVDSSNEHVASPSMESTESVPREKISRRERKMQERWTNSTNHPEQLPPKTFLGVEFPPIAVLRRKFSSLPPTSPPLLTTLPIKKKNSSSSSIKAKAFFNQIDSTVSTIFKSSMSLPDQEIDPTIVDQTNAAQVLDLQATDTSSLNAQRNNDIQSALTSLSELLTDQKNVREDMNDKIEQERNSENVSSSAASSSSSPGLTTNPNEEKTIEYLSKEIEEEHDDNADNVDREKKNEYIDHALGTVSINSEPMQVILLGQEKEKEEEETERPSSFSPTEEPCKHLQVENEPSEPVLPGNSDAMMNINQNEQRYKTVEIEEISDEDDDLSIQNNTSIEPTDCILTDDELKIPTKPSNIKPFKFNPVLSCYEKALSKTVESIDDPIKPVEQSQMPPIPKRHQCPEDDPIALRALQRFQERMNAAAKTSNEETSPSILKGKSSWSGTLSTPRKSVENLFKANQQTQSISTSTTEEGSSQRDTFIRPRKTMLDDIGLNFGMTLNLFGVDQSKSIEKDDQQQKLEEQQQPTATVEDDNKQNEPKTKMIDSEHFPQPMNIDSSMTNESSFANEADHSNLLPVPPLDSSLNTVISHSSTEQQTLSPYRLQLEGRRRLNTLERIRERQFNQESNDPPQQFQLQNEYTFKPEDLQDPIIRRALERFDEKSRSLAQAKTSNYDDVQDPITRRALMRLDTNLKRTIPSHPPSSANIDPNETWYTNSYTLGSLQSNNDPRFIRYPDSALPPTANHKPSHVSIHQRFCSTSSSEMPEFSPNPPLSNNDQNIPIMRVPVQPIYVTSNHQPPISLRQRSRSEDMLSSRDLSIGQTTNLDEMEISPLQRNRSSNELQPQSQGEDEAFISNESDFPVPTPIIKTLDPNFIRSAETSLNYATPTQTYAGYSCEYTRPHRHQSLNSTKSETSSPRNYQQENEMQSSSAFLPVHPSTNHYYPQPPLPAPSYNSMYTSNNSHQTPYSDDPIVRRALERFNCQMQNSLMGASQHPPNMGYMPQQFSNGYPPRQGSFDGFHPADPQQHEAWINANRSMAPPSTTSTGYQSIIGRRRQIRHDDAYHDHTSVGNGYSTSLFLTSQNSYPYMNFSEEPPVVPPRLHRDLYHEQQEYLSENMNNNNNNNGYGHHVYPGGIINGFHPMHQQYIPGEYFPQISDEEYLRNRAQSTSSNTSSDSVNQIRLMQQQRLPPTSVRTNPPTNKINSSDQSQIPSDQTTPSNGNAAGDSVFHRLAYTATKSSLSKSSSNLCANLLTKPPPQQPPPPPPPPSSSSQQDKSSNLKTHEVDYDESSTNNEQNTESVSSATNLSNKCQRSRSVDGRARLKNAQTRANNSARSTNDDDDSAPSTSVPSSKFTSVNPRRDAPPPRIPITPRSNLSDRTSANKRLPNGNNLSYTKNGHGIRVRGSSGNLIDTENEENSSFSEHYEPKIIDNKTRTAIPVHRYSTSNNHIQPSASTSSVNSTHSRTKVPILTSTHLDRRDSNTSGSDLSRSAKRSDDNRLLSPAGHRRAIPVSVFAPAKLESKQSAPPPPTSSTSPANESTSTLNSESQQEHQTSLSLTNVDSSYPTINSENEFNSKLSSTNSALKSSSGNLLHELSLANDNSKKMNVFERLFRGHKKKI